MKTVTCVLFIVVLFSTCIYQKEMTVQDWREHLLFMNPSLGQDPTSMVSGFHNLEGLPQGTRIVFSVESKGVFQGTQVISTSTMSITILGSEIVSGVDCTVMDILTDIDTVTEGEPMTITVKGKEWVDRAGTPVKVEEEVVMKFNEYEVPMSLKVTRTGEETYEGHDCWILTGTQTIVVMGQSLGESEVTEYVDKETSVVVRSVTTVGEEVVDTGYIRPPIPVQNLQWELGGKEEVTTESGNYECQVIYLKENDNIVGTVWASEEVRAPVKYTYSYKAENTNMNITMTLLEYTWGQ